MQLRALLALPLPPGVGALVSGQLVNPLSKALRAVLRASGTSGGLVCRWALTGYVKPCRWSLSVHPVAVRRYRSVMGDIAEWLGLGGYSPDQWQAFGTMVTAGVAIAAAAIAWWQVHHAREARKEEAIRAREAQEVETRRARELQEAGIRHARELQEEQAQPNVGVYIERNAAVGAPLIDFIIVNHGLTVAYDVKVKFLQKPETTLDSSGYPLSESKLLRDGVPTLPPGGRIVALFDNAIDRWQRKDLPDSYDVEVTYRDSRNKQYGPLLYPLDFGVRYGLYHATEYGTHHGAKALREIEKTLKMWTEDMSGGLAVFTRDGEAKDECEKEQRREAQARYESNRRENGSVISELREQEIEEERHTQEE